MPESIIRSRDVPPQPPLRRSWRLNVRSLAVLVAVLAATAAAGGALWYVQSARNRPAMVTQARAMADQGQDDLALSFLNRYLASEPRDLEALNLKAEILAKTAQSVAHLDEVIALSETILRLAPEPKDPEEAERLRQTRRRLVEAYLAQGPLVAQTQNKYASAEELARDLVEDTGLAADLRLHARTLERLGLVSGSRDRFAEAASEFQKARALDPKDVEGAERAAFLYSINLEDPAAADAVIEGLIRDNPTAPALLAAARVHSRMAASLAASGKAADADRRRAEVASLLDRAVAEAPRDLSVLLAAAEYDLAERRPADAAVLLDRVEETDRKDFRYRTLAGIVDLYQNKTADAIESWKKGLIATEGGDAQLSWRLAYILLKLGRIDEAAPLISQYRRTAGGDEISPPARYLEALKFLKLNHPVEAVAELEKGAPQVAEGLKPEYYYTLGQAREATRDEARAMEAYADAIAADPRLAAPRLARVRLLQDARPDAAREELRRGLEEAGEDPALLAATARMELQKQRRLPAGKRDWTALNNLLERGRKVAPAMPALAVVRADAMAAMGKTADAADLLAKATAIDASDVDLWAARAEALKALGRVDEALLVLDQAAAPEAAGDQARFRVLRARYLTDQGHGREAREGLIRDQERVRPDQRPLLWMALGELYAAQGDASGARKAYAEWARLLPDDPLPRLAVLEMALDDPSPEAEAVAQDSRKVLTDKIGGLFGQIAEATVLLHDRSEAKESAEDRRLRLARVEGLIARIEAEAPKQRFGPLLRGQLAGRRNDPAAAAAAFEKALVADGGRGVLPRLVKLYSDMGGHDADLTRLRETYADAVPGLARLETELYARQGDKQRAESLARQVVEGDAESLDARVWQARVLNTLGKPEEAEKALRDLVESDPGSLGPWLALMYFQVSRKQPEEAARTVESMIQKARDVERPDLVWAQAWRVVGDRARADSAFETALSRWPDDPRVTRAAAQYYESSNRLREAQTTLRGVLDRDPSQTWAARGLALLLSARTSDPSAWREARRLTEAPAPGGDLPEDRLVRALVLARGPDASRRDEAVGLLEALLDDLPAALPAAKTARELLAKVLLRTDPARSSEYAATDASAATATPAALALYAEALIGAKKLDEAEAQYARFVATAPGDPNALAILAHLRHAQGRDDDAVAALERAASDKMDTPEGEAIGRQVVQVLLNDLKKPEAAERVAKKLKDKYPGSASVLAAVMARQGRRDEALQSYLDAIRDGDSKSLGEAVGDNLGLIVREDYAPESVEMAEAVVDAARQKAPKNPDLLAVAAQLRHRQDLYDEEVKLYEGALALQPENFAIRNNLAWVLSEGLDRPEDALKQVDAAIQKAAVVPPQFYDTRGVILTRLGRYDEAIKDLERAVEDRPIGTIWAHLARAYHKAGKTEKFQEARAKARTATPPFKPEDAERSEKAELESLILGGAP